VVARWIKPSSFMLFAENPRLNSSRAGKAKEALPLIYVMSEPPPSLASVSGWKRISPQINPSSSTGIAVFVLQ